MKKLAVILSIAVALAGFMTISAHASFVPIGSALTFNNSGVPGSYPVTGTFGTPIVSGDITITTTQVATPGGGEWDNFFIKTNDGASISNTTGYWEVNLSYVLNQNVNFDGVESQFADSGTPVGSGSSTPFGPYGTGPLGDGFVNGYGTSGSPFSATITPAIATNWTQIYMTPWSYYSSTYGFSSANEFNFALHFDSLTPVPEPSTMLLIGFGLIGAAALRKRWSA